MGDDHLDVDRVVLKARRGKRTEWKAGHSGGGAPGGSDPEGAARRKRLEQESEELTRRIGDAEAYIGEIDARFTEPAYFEETSGEEIAALRAERADIQEKLEDGMVRWDWVERELEASG